MNLRRKALVREAGRGNKPSEKKKTGISDRYPLGGRVKQGDPFLLIHWEVEHGGNARGRKRGG